MEIIVQVQDTRYAVDGLVLPPIGTRFTVHQNLTDSRRSVVLEVIDHEWTLEEAGFVESGASGLPFFAVTVVTREIK